jgi:hypothetical protein
MPRKLTVGKTSKISIYQRSNGRWIVDWYDEHGARRNPSFATLKEAEAFQKQKRAALDRHRETRFDVDPAFGRGYPKIPRRQGEPLIGIHG